ncbi:MAG: CDP-diacylglycerol--serine O-phosphatidyltransferase [Nevskia sp.]|jgi:CDP-diacylglycerol---serine O-phosphatidyltransferase|nr:CDP-diacylglycerol--serine O-phosphatidyltransferase [Nevskia sp.]
MNEPANSPMRRRRKGIYLLPNLFTTGTLFGGFFAIVSSMSGHFDNAAIGILFAMVADGLDGRIARLTNTATDFGKEYDSLCDMAAFGIASSIVVYAYSLHFLSEYRWLSGTLGGVLALTYATCAALRLARFNVLTAIAGSSKDFFGLPSPAAAGVVVFFVWTAQHYGWSGDAVVLPAGLITLAAGLLMVSSVRYNSFKKINLAGRMRFLPFAAVIGVLALISTNPPLMLFLIFLIYAASGPAAVLFRRLRPKPIAPSGS